MASTGTTTQSISIITQAAAAYQQLNAQLTDVVTTTAHPSEVADAELVSYVFGSDGVSLTTTETLSSAVSTSDEATYEVDILLESVVTATESLLGTEWTTTISPSTFEAKDKITYETSLLIDATVQVTDSFVEISRDVELEGVATIIGTIDPGVIYNQLVTSTVYAQEIFTVGRDESIVENLTATDTITYTVEITELLSAEADVTDSQEWWAIQYEELEATAAGSEAFNFEGSIHNNELESTVRAIDSMWAKDFGAIAWTMNTKSGALSNYDNYGFTSLAFHNGKMYATSPEGIFEMGADNDDGRKIDALAKRGFEDFETDEKKHVSDIYVGYTGGELECDVETYDGPEEVYTYSMEQRDADAPRNNRLKVGRGLSSRYWRLAFRNVGGADFQIHDISVNTAVSKRRL